MNSRFLRAMAFGLVGAAVVAGAGAIGAGVIRGGDATTSAGSAVAVSMEQPERISQPQRQASQPQASAATAWAVDATHSGVSFMIMRGPSEFHGRFNQMSGSISFDPTTTAGASFAIEVPIASLDTNNRTRDQHLSAADFFNAVQFPTISFRSTGLSEAPAPAGAPEGQKFFTLSGDLTLHGETKSIEAELAFLGAGELQGKTNAGLRATFTIDRNDFGLTKWKGVLGDEVTLTVWINATR